MQVSDAAAINGILLVLQLIILPVQGWIGVTLWRLREQISQSAQTTAVLDKHVMDKHSHFQIRLDDHEERIRGMERLRTLDAR